MASKSQQSKSWCFTLNNPAEAHVLIMDERVQYLVWQREKAPTTGTIHFQGWLYLKKKTTKSTVKEILVAIGAKNAHFELCRGSPRSNYDYCIKAETALDGPYELGKKPFQGERTDLEELKADLLSNVPMADISERHFSAFIRYHRGIREFKRLRETRRSWKTKVYVTGTYRL